jgi:hypothetical protein
VLATVLQSGKKERERAREGGRRERVESKNVSVKIDKDIEQ